jgi:hypothetical protein
VERVYLQWNLINWVTVVLMAAIGMALVGFVASGVRQYTGQSDGA